MVLKPRVASIPWVSAALLLNFGGCDATRPGWTARSMSVAEEQSPLSSSSPPKPEPIIGAVARRVAVHSRPTPRAGVLGYLTAGAILARSPAPVGTDGCANGWYSVPPEGFVCLDAQTTIDPQHATLLARGLSPRKQGPLPYPYATARRTLSLYEPDPHHQDGVRERGRIGIGSTFAVVGTWDTLDDYDQRQRLAMLTLGVFVPTRDIEPVRVAAVGSNPLIALAPPAPLKELPDFATSTTRWIDVDLARGVVAAYIGNHHSDVMSILVRPSDGAKRGISRLRSKHITELSSSTSSVEARRSDLDWPWVIELESGIFLRGTVVPQVGGSAAPSQNTIELSPEDAARLFRFVEPEIPNGWHSVVIDTPRKLSTRFRLH